MLTLDPKVAKAIKESEAGRAFISFIAGHLLALDSVSGIDLDDPNEIAVEVKGRKRAKEKLELILSGLLTSSEANTIKDERDSFSVEVDPPPKGSN